MMNRITFPATSLVTAERLVRQIKGSGVIFPGHGDTITISHTGDRYKNPYYVVIETNRLAGMVLDLQGAGWL